MAASVLLLVHVTFLFVALSGVTVASSASVAPVSNASSVLFSSILLTNTSPGFGSLTVTSQLALFPLPSAAVAVTVAVPADTAVTFPAWSTVTIASSSLVHKTSLFVALSGFTVAVSVVVASVFNSSVSLSRETSVTSLTLFFTYTESVSSVSPFTRIIAEIGATVTLPSVMVSSTLIPAFLSSTQICQSPSGALSYAYRSISFSDVVALKITTIPSDTSSGTFSPLNTNMITSLVIHLYSTFSATSAAVVKRSAE